MQYDLIPQGLPGPPGEKGETGDVGQMVRTSEWISNNNMIGLHMTNVFPHYAVCSLP